MILDHVQQPLGLPEREVEQLLEEERDEERALLMRRPADAPPPLPEGELFGTDAHGLHREAEAVDGDVVVPAEVDRCFVKPEREDVDPRLTDKAEYPGRHYDLGSVHPVTLDFQRLNGLRYLYN